MADKPSAAAGGLNVLEERGERRVVTDFWELPADVQEYYLRSCLVMNFIARRLRGVRAGRTWGDRQSRPMV
jgi:hypothetical protein